MTQHANPTKSWSFDVSHSQIGFAVRHMLISKVRGRFGQWSAELALDPDDLTRAAVTVTIDARSIDTNEPKRDEHLRSADFFDVERYPSLTFVSKGITDLGKGKLLVAGDLTIRDVTREVELTAEVTGRGVDPWGGERIAFEARTRINRKDFGLHWNQVLEAGGVLVGEDVEIAIEAQAVASKAGEEAA